jgi:hypothetical protein
MLKLFFNLIQVIRFFILIIKIRSTFFFIDERLEDFILTKLDQKSLNKANIHEQLGHCMCEAGNEFGPSTQYGTKTLIYFFSKF